MKRISLTLLCLIAAAQLQAQESQLGAEFRHEREAFSKGCLGFKLIDCGQTLFTGDPLHIAVGSIAPKNGTGVGLALQGHTTPNERWRLLWSADAVATQNLSWRAGAYLSAVLIRRQTIGVATGNRVGVPRVAVHEMPVFHVYAQSTSLNSIPFYGLGPNSGSRLTFYGMTETTAGLNVVWPLWDALHVSLFGEANGRFYSLRDASNAAGLQVETAYNQSTAPGLLAQNSFAQFGEGIRMNPTFAAGHVELHYQAGFEEWASPGSPYSFQRFKADLTHQFNLYRNQPAFQPRAFNTPNSCSQEVTSPACPPLSTRNLEGGVELRFLYTASRTGAGNVVPFYLDPTIGGSDINGTALLASLPDYRYRAPDLMVFRFAFEHSIYKWPIGAKIMLDEGKVGSNSGDLGFGHFRHSYAAGLTLHAGGLPVVDLLFAWGGGYGTHTIATVSPSLLGGTARPPLD